MSKILLDDIWITQRNLKRTDQIPDMIACLAEGGVLPKIVLNLCDDDTLEVQDGHHRLLAYYLAGREYIFDGEYRLQYTRYAKPRFGKVSDYDYDRYNDNAYSNDPYDHGFQGV